MKNYKLKKALIDLLRVIPGWENLSDREVEEKAGEEIMNLKSAYPDDSPEQLMEHARKWRELVGENTHLLIKEKY